MPHLAIGEANNASILALRVFNDRGQLYVPATVSYVVNDDSGTQVYPSVGSEDVSDVAASLGVYPAWDVDRGIGLKPGTSWSATEGRHTIVWTYTDDSNAQRTFEQRFWVSATGTGLGFWSYVSPNEVRAAGLSESDISNSALIDLLRRTHQYIEQYCRQTFRPVAQTMTLDGTGTEKLLLPVPIVAIEWVKPNNRTDAADNVWWAAQFVPSNNNDPGMFTHDWRRNPAIMMVAENRIFSGTPVGYPVPLPSGVTYVFGRGPRNQQIKGIFGFLEPDGTTPELIKEAALRLVLATYKGITPSNAVGSGAYGPMRSLQIGREMRMWDTGHTGIIRASALSTSTEVEEALRMYRAPARVVMVG